MAADPSEPDGEVAQDVRHAQLGRAVAAVVHEIRNPLAAVSTLVQVLQTEEAIEADPELQELCDKTLDEVQRMAGMLEDLLGFGAPPSLNPVSLEPAVEIEAHLSALRAKIPASADAGARIELLVPPALRDAGRCRLDSAALRTIVVGVVRAGLASGGDASAVVRVHASREADALHLRVHDRGAPFAAADLGRAFEPYVARQGARGGLALATAAVRVRQCGGTIAVETSVPGTTEIAIVLPTTWA
ncbi:MAG: HAMP domain-containing sensor histidine kinase [Myxococcota bacterium]